MKLQLILVSLIINTEFVYATTQNKFNPDKPTIVYINKYEDDWKNTSGDFSSGGSKKYNATAHSYIGNGSYFFHYGEGYGWWDTDYQWSYTNQIGTYTIIGYDANDDTLDGTGVGYGDFLYAFPYNIPSKSLDSYDQSLSHYYANVNYSFGELESYSRNSRTFMQIQTGGKTGIDLKNIFMISASATEYGSPTYISSGGTLGDVWYDAISLSAIDPIRIRVLGKNLGIDGSVLI